MTNRSSISQFHAMTELTELTTEELSALWELVPTDRQRRYMDCLSAYLQFKGAQGSDVAEKHCVDLFIREYTTNLIVPIGTHWVKTPQHVLEHAQQNQPLSGVEEARAAEDQRRPANPKLFFGIGVLVFICFLGFIFLRGGAEEPVSSAQGAATVVVSPTLRHTLTPTPIALVESDAVIREGDLDRDLAYPIGLQVLPLEAEQPRVFIVQRRKVELAEWQFDNNPDTASFLSDLPIQQVVGIPYSPENQVLFDGLSAGATLTLRLNTGAELRFAFRTKQQVARSDTQFLRQVEPGLTLILIGETDADGLPTAERWVVTTTYIAEQELTREGGLAISSQLPTPVPTLAPLPSVTPIPLDPRTQLQVTLIEGGVATHRETQTLVVRLRVYNPLLEAVVLSGSDFQLALGYAALPPGPWTTAQTLEPLTLLPGQAVDLTFYWNWQGEPYATLRVLAYQFALTF